ncbi:MAG: hypothetical protein PHC41_00870 [Lachnospiraceae bacterium]|jgi:hypothetical protein|nr:hypothetical protein [Lachnospiraceae bacterium]MDD3614757.1 hypothetical protein [Lachnospiraceae bacterium]
MSESLFAVAHAAAFLEIIIVFIRIMIIENQTKYKWNYPVGILYGKSNRKKRGSQIKLSKVPKIINK